MLFAAVLAAAVLLVIFLCIHCRILRPHDLAETSASRIAIADSMNKGMREGVDYKGSVLLSMHHKLVEEIQRSSKGVSKHTLSKKGEHKLSEKVKEQWMQTKGAGTSIKLRATIYEGHELGGEGKVFVTVDFDPVGSTNKQYDDNAYVLHP